MGLLRRRYQSQGQRWWSYRPSLCHPSSDFQISGSLLPEIRRRGLQEGDQGHPHLLRQIALGRRPQAERTQEVRRSWCQSALPEILSLRSFIPSFWAKVKSRLLFHLYGSWEHSGRRLSLSLSRSPSRFVLKKIFVP